MEPCLRENGGVPPASGESLMVDVVMVADDRVEETCTYRPLMLEKENGEGSGDSPKASIKGKGSRIGIRLVVTTLVDQGNRNRVMGSKDGVQAEWGTELWGRSGFQKDPKVAVTLKEGVLNPAKHSTIFFKENNHPNPFEPEDDDRPEVLGKDDSTSKGQIAGGKVGAGRNCKKLNKKKRDRESHFKMSSSSRVPLSKSVNNMVGHIFSQIGKKGDTRGLKVVEKQLEVEDVIQN
ncbi:hypothetical protein GOBAR_DD31508 [Gossypium barbadense]|nr:hypothetical protein GOBAR_DD31508 [Gossypium barbadense]